MQVHDFDYDVAVIGAGAAGYFAAIAAAEGGARVALLEKTSKTLAKVRISGGGRCNVTHASPDLHHLLSHYPRGAEALSLCFSQFDNRDTVAWFARRDVDLKTEPDGRMFPDTDDAETIACCLEDAAAQAGVRLLIQTAVQALEVLEGGYRLCCPGRPALTSKTVIVTTGGGPKLDSYAWLSTMGYTIIQPIPSLFTFNLPGERALASLAGVAVGHAQVHLPELGAQQTGPVLATHWGISGPAVLRLSAWQARGLATAGYQARVEVNWLSTPRLVTEKALLAQAQQEGRRQLSNLKPDQLPARLYEYLYTRSGLPAQLKGAETGKKHITALGQALCQDTYQMQGKTTFKEEFVTCGGIALGQVDFATMASHLHPGLYFAGEVLDVDAITGGFNFQAAWSTGFVAGTHAAVAIK